MRTKDSELQLEAYLALKKWQKYHQEVTGHAVWLHSRRNDMATACFQCVKEATRERSS